MAKSAKATIELAAQKSDEWLEANETEVTRLHELHVATQKAVEKATLELYNKHYEERKASFAKIPQFWFSTFMKHPQLSLFLAASGDQEALTYLEDVAIVRGGDKKNIAEFDVVFTFKENPFFQENTLTKSYTLAPQDHSGHNHAEGEGHDEEELAGNVVPITWKDASRNLVKASPRKVGGDDDDDESALEPGSFFCLFTEAEDPFNLGEVLRDEVVPNALELFAGMADLSDDEDDFSESDDEEDLDPRPTKKSKN